MLRFPVSLMKRLKQVESAVVELCMCSVLPYKSHLKLIFESNKIKL